MITLKIIVKIKNFSEIPALESEEQYVNLKEMAQLAAMNYPETNIVIRGDWDAFADQSVKFVFDHLLKMP